MITKYDYEQPSMEITRQENKAIVTCQHQHEIRKQVQSNGTEHFKEQCIKCGKLGKNFSKAMLTSDQMSTAPSVDKEMQEQSYYYHDSHPVIQENKSNRKELWANWYKGYLGSKVWRDKRKLVLERARGNCEACQSAKATQVHHLTYARVGKEALFDLVAVCDSCHHDIHDDHFPSLERQAGIQSAIESFTDF
ncbi:MAG: HNH endonuclease signature motif containing protein [Anaerolineae bacterium]